MANAAKVQGSASYFPAIEKKYGQLIEHWFNLLRSAGNLKHAGLVA